MDKLRELLRDCKTDKQARSAIGKAGYKIVRDDTADIGSFSVWIDNRTRIYKTHLTREYILQKWHKVKVSYSGIPVFF